MKKVFFRIYQYISSKVQFILPWRKPDLIQGEDCYEKLIEQLKKDCVNKALIATTHGFVKRNTLNDLLVELENGNIEYIIYDKVTPDPTVSLVEDSLEVYSRNNCNGIIAFGGGSVMDLAKAIGARVARPNKSLNEMAGLFKVRKKIPPLYTIPTTAGTGSETTVASVITDEVTQHKYAINDISLIPKYAVLNPELLTGLPEFLTATTGMDALTHAVEAYTNKFGPKESRDYAEKAVKLIFENLQASYMDGENIEARNNMLVGSFYAGAAFTRAYVGNVHAIAHTLGGKYHVAHGHANAVLLPMVMRKYGESVYEDLSKLADIVGIKGVNNKDKSLKFIEEIEKLNEFMKIKNDFGDKIKIEDIDEMASWAYKEANPIYPVPVIWDIENYKEMIMSLK